MLTPITQALKERRHARHAAKTAARALRQPSGLRIALAERIAQLNPADWDAVVAGQSWFFSRDYLALLEAVPPDDIEARYALIHDDDGPVAALVLQWVALAGADLRPLPETPDDEASPLRRLLGRVARRPSQALATRLRERVLVCGNLLTYGEHAVAVAADVEPASIWPAVAEALYRLRRAEKLAGQAGFVLIKDVALERPQGIELLRRVGYRQIESEPNMLLALDPAWRDHAAYLASLTSKYRSAVKKQIVEPIEAAGLQLRPFEADAALGARMHELYLQVHAKAALRPFTLHPGYFHALQQAAGARLRCSGLFDPAGQLLGFICTLRDEAQALAYHIGFDRAAAAAAPLYLRLLHASIADAIALGATELSFGRTALEPKARLGAKPQALAVWVRHRQPLFNRLIKPLLLRAHHDDAPECNPFKK